MLRPANQLCATPIPSQKSIPFGSSIGQKSIPFQTSRVAAPVIPHTHEIREGQVTARARSNRRAVTRLDWLGLANGALDGSTRTPGSAAGSGRVSVSVNLVGRPDHANASRPAPTPATRVQGQACPLRRRPTTGEGSERVTLTATAAPCSRGTSDPATIHDAGAEFRAHLGRVCDVAVDLTDGPVVVRATQVIDENDADRRRHVPRPLSVTVFGMSTCP